MVKFVGVVCLVVGLVLIFWGHEMAQSVGGRVQNLFTGSPDDQPMWLYIGGGMLCALGIFQIFAGKK